MYFQKDLYIDVHNNFTWISQELETVWVSINRRIVVWSRDEIQLSTVKEQTTDICNMDKSQKHAE